MATTNSTDYTLISAKLEGYANAFLPEMNPLMKLGVVRVDQNPFFAQQGGNSFTVRKHIYDSGAWAAPVIDTAVTASAITSVNEKGVVCRRVNRWGINWAALLASGDSTAIADYARIAAHNFSLNLDKAYLYYLLPGLFASGGALADTSSYVVDQSTVTLDVASIVKAQGYLGERMGMLDTLITHPTTYANSQLNELVTGTENYDLIREYQETGVTYKGMFGGLRVILDSNCYNTGGVYYSYVLGQGSLYLGWQQPMKMSTYYREEYAGGTDYVQYSAAYGAHVPGTTWNTTDPTGIGGATDAQLATVGDWTTTTSVSRGEILAACILSKEA